jgi:tripartite-type tricarboxylate transporter receptor subunit TctC
MPREVVNRLHDAFKRTIDDPEHMKTLQQLDQLYWYKSSEEYAQWAAEAYRAERATIERVGLLAK